MRYANGVTFCTARSMVSATLVKAVITRDAAKLPQTRGYRNAMGPSERVGSVRPMGNVGTLHCQEFMLAFLRPFIAGLSISWPSLIATLKKRNHLGGTSPPLI